MSRIIRPAVVLAVVVAAFLGPASVAFALWSTSASGTLTVTTAAAAGTTTPTPTCRTSNSAPDGAILDWTATGTTYKLTRSLTKDGGYASVPLTPATATSYTAVHGQGQQFFYRVVALSSTGVESAPSQAVLIGRNGNSANYSCLVQP